MMLRKVDMTGPCPCGSRKQFALCCQPAVVEEMRRQTNQLKFPGPPLLKFEAGDRVYRIVRNRIMTRNKRERLSAFTVHWLYWKFGEHWFERQKQLPESKRHVVATWLAEYWRWNNESYLSPSVGPDAMVYPPGNVREVLTLASDVYTLMLTDSMPDSLLNRLRDFDQYQGARYEAGVAAALIRAGFELDWRKAATAGKIPEFDARHKVSGEVVAIEAKSKHRAGSLHFDGTLNFHKNAKADVMALYGKAVSKRPADRPFGIFIDINLPHDRKTPGPIEDWTDQLLEALASESLFKDAESPEHSFLIVTNSAWHYDGTNDTGPGRYISMWPQKGEGLVRHPHTVAAVQFAMQNFGIILDD